MPQKSLKKNALLNFIKSVLNTAYPIITFPYASRILMPEGLGKVNFANSVIEYFLIIAELGISTYAVREAAKIRDNRERLSKFCREILCMHILSTIFAYLLLAVGFIFVDKINEYRILIIISSVKILFSTIGIGWFYTALEEYGYITIRHAVFQIISLIALFTLVKRPEDYHIYAAIGVFSNVGSYLVNFLHARKFIDLFRHTRLELRRHLKPILTFFGISCATKLNTALDAVMLGFISGDRAVGFYAAAFKLTKLVIELITSVISIFMPRSSYYLEANRTDEYRKIISKVCGMAYFFALPTSAGLFFLSRPLLSTFSGDAYLPAAQSMRILSIGIIAWCTNSFLGNLIITPQRKERFSLAAQIVAAACNIILNVLLIKKYGVLGAAIATVIVEFITATILLFPSWKYIHSRNSAKNIVKALAGTLVMYGIIHHAFGNIQNDALAILCSAVTGCVVYALFEILMKNETAQMLCGILTKRRNARPR